MEFVDWVALVRRYLALIVALAIVGGGAGWGFSTQQAPRYRATTTLLINPAVPNQLVPFLSSGTAGGGVSSESLANSYRAYLESHQFYLLVVQHMKEPLAPEVLSRQVTAQLVPGTNFFTITAFSDNPARAEQLANGVADTFIAGHNQKVAQQALGSANVPDQPTAVVLDRATATLVPPSISVARSIALSAFAGVLLGLSCVYLLAQFDRRLRSTTDVARYLGKVPLGTITSLSEQHRFRRPTLQHKLVMEPGHNAAQRDVFRRLRANVECTVIDRPIHSLAVTSALPGEGKTIVAANLAIALAEGGQRVLLVDANLYRPGLHTIFQMPNRVGFSDLLRNRDLTVFDVAQPSRVQPNLHVVTSGDPSGTEGLLTTQSAAMLIAQLGQGVDVVVYDTPDVKMATDSILLAASCDATLLVVRAETTRREEAAAALADLVPSRTNVLGVVLNGVKIRSRWPRSAATFDPVKQVPSISGEIEKTSRDQMLLTDPRTPVTSSGRDVAPRVTWQRPVSTRPPLRAQSDLTSDTTRKLS